MLNGSMTVKMRQKNKTTFVKQQQIQVSSWERQIIFFF